MDLGAKGGGQAEVGELDLATADPHPVHAVGKGCRGGGLFLFFRLYRRGLGLHHLGKIQGMILVDDELAGRLHHLELADGKLVRRQLQLQLLGLHRLPAHQSFLAVRLGDSQVFDLDAALISGAGFGVLDAMAQGAIGGEAT